MLVSLCNCGSLMYTAGVTAPAFLFPALVFLCRPGVPALNVISDVLFGGYKGFMTCFCFSPLWPQ